MYYTKRNILPFITSTVVLVSHCIRFLTTISRRIVKFTAHILHCL